MTHAEADRYRLDALLDVMSTGVLFLDAERRVICCNRAYRTLWQLPDEALAVGEAAAAVTQLTAALRADDAAYRQHLREAVRSGGASAPYDILLANGTILCETSRPVLGPAGETLGRVWLFEDVTEQRTSRQKLVELAERDPLTNLYNRRRFQSELDRMLAEASRRGSQIGLVMFDLDAFKPVNDRYGHKAGDEVLVALAAAVSGTVRRNEQLFRIGGDEFAMLVPEAQELELSGLARRILGRIDELEFSFDGDTVHISVSLGIAIYPTHALVADALLQCADQPMYAVKAGGRHGWGFFDAQAL